MSDAKHNESLRGEPMTNDNYLEWIHANVDKLTGGYGKCREVCTAMVSAFPELSLRRGVFHSRAWGDRTHWWCRTPSGRIVDPTARQHPDGRLLPADDGHYDDLTDVSEAEAITAGKIPSGKCLDCGSLIYGGATSFCSDTCTRAFERYMETNGG